MTEFKIEYFCDENNLLFKKYYDYLNNPIYVNFLLIMIKKTEEKEIKKKILKMIIKNHTYILERLNMIDKVIFYYKQNNLINKSEIGHFFTFYEKNRKLLNVNNNAHLLNLFYKLINYEKCVSVLKECFYIFSDYRACIYFLTPSIDFNNTKKSILNKVINNFKDNTNTLTQIISKTYVGDKTPWGSPYYSTAYAMFDTLIIIKKYYKDKFKPLDKLDIIFKINKKCKKNIIIKKLYKEYDNKKLLNSELNNVNNVSHFLISLKKLGYDMWFSIPLIFNTIYESYELNNIMDAKIYDHDKIYYQKTNNKLGIMCYILVADGFITNANIFQKFNI